jgi:hypothetical protein
LAGVVKVPSDGAGELPEAWRAIGQNLLGVEVDVMGKIGEWPVVRRIIVPKAQSP